MKQKKLARVCSLAMAALMATAMLAGPVFAADNDPEKVIDTGVVQVQSPSAAGGVVTSHTYNIIRVFDKYVIQEAAAGQEAMYQYKLTAKLGGGADVTEVVFGDFTVDAQTGKITYLKGIEGKEQVITADNAGSTLNGNTNTSLGAQFATAIAQYCADHNVAADATVAGGGTTDAIQQGYYVLYEQKNESNPDDGLIASKPILFNLEAQAILTPKDAKVELDKTITGSTTDNGNTGDYNIGDTINYEIDTNFPTYEANVDDKSLVFRLVDTLSAGLTLDNQSVVVQIDGTTTVASTDTAKTYTLSTVGNVITVEFDSAFIAAHQGEEIHVAYSCVLNDNAVIHDAGNPNNVEVEFSRNPENPTDSSKLEDENTVYTYGLDFVKLDGTHDELLEGAKFQLSRGNNVVQLIKVAGDEEGAVYDIYRPALESEIESAEAGTIINEFETTGKEVRFIGLDAGTYSLTETKAPAGFAALNGSLEFTITAKPATDDPATANVNETADLSGDAVVTTDSTNMIIDTKQGVEAGLLTAEYDTDLVVKNYEGVSLPATGAMTSLLVMGAGAAIVGGGALFMARRKKEDDED